MQARGRQRRLPVNCAPRPLRWHSNCHHDESRSYRAGVRQPCFDRNTPQELSERIKDAFQRRGFFKTEVVKPLHVAVIDGLARPSPVDVEAVIKEGDRYRLGNIELRGYKAFDSQTLRPLFPLNRGDIFDIEKVRQGLEALRDLYGESGYLNFTPVPDTQFDESNHTISLVMDVDEGEQFRIEAVEFNAPRAVAAGLRGAWKLKIGDVYSSGYATKFFADNREPMPPAASASRASRPASASTSLMRLLIAGFPRNTYEKVTGSE